MEGNSASTHEGGREGPNMTAQGGDNFTSSFSSKGKEKTFRDGRKRREVQGCFGPVAGSLV